MSRKGKYHSLTFNDLGIIMKLKGDYDQALTYFEESIQMLPVDAPYFQERFLQATSNIGETFMQLKNFKVARGHLEKAREIIQAIDYDHWTKLRVLNNLGQISQEKEQFDSATYFFNRVTNESKFGQKSMEDEEYLFAHEQLVAIYERLNDKDKVIEHLKHRSEHDKMIREKYGKMDKLYTQFMVQLAMFEIKEESTRKLHEEQLTKWYIIVASGIGIIILVILLYLKVINTRKRDKKLEEFLESW